MTTEYSIEVTKINNKFHCRLFRLDEVVDEVACELRLDIGYVCREMLRTIDKGGGDDFTSAARNRHKSGSVGKIFWNVRENLR